MENGSFNNLLARSYHKLEVLDHLTSRESIPKARLAVWRKGDTDGYNIEMLHWNGQRFEPSEISSSYYLGRVVPHYAKMVRLMPYSPSNWYNLADALEKSRAYGDALTAVEVGKSLDVNSSLSEKFTALRNKITGK